MKFLSLDKAQKIKLYDYVLGEYDEKKTILVIYQSGVHFIHNNKYMNKINLLLTLTSGTCVKSISIC